MSNQSSSASGNATTAAPAQQNAAAQTTTASNGQVFHEVHEEGYFRGTDPWSFTYVPGTSTSTTQQAESSATDQQIPRPRRHHIDTTNLLMYQGTWVEERYHQLNQMDPNDDEAWHREYTRLMNEINWSREQAIRETPRWEPVPRMLIVPRPRRGSSPVDFRDRRLWREGEEEMQPRVRHAFLQADHTRRLWEQEELVDGPVSHEGLLMLEEMGYVRQRRAEEND